MIQNNDRKGKSKTGRVIENILAVSLVGVGMSIPAYLLISSKVNLLDPVESRRPVAAYSSDFNQDGIPDIFARDSFDTRYIFIGQGNGSYIPFSDYLHEKHPSFDGLGEEYRAVNERIDAFLKEKEKRK